MGKNIGQNCSDLTPQVEGTWHNGNFQLAPKGPLPRDVHISGNRIALPGMTGTPARLTFIIQPSNATSPNGIYREPPKALAHEEQVRFL